MEKERIIEITSLEQPGVELFGALTEAQLRNRLEPEKGCHRRKPESNPRGAGRGLRAAGAAVRAEAPCGRRPPTSLPDARTYPSTPADASCSPGLRAIP